MPLLGAHMSSAGGLHNALSRAKSYGCEAVQLFTKAPNQWRGKPISDDDANQFQSVLAETALQFPIVHDSYLINLASPDDALWRKSIDVFVDELERAAKIGAEYLVMHPGAHLGAGEEVGLNRVAVALDEVHSRCPNLRTQVLLETTAGQGTTLGHRFEHLAAILNRVKAADRLAVCIDTCHIFAAGYPLSPRREYLKTMRLFDKLIGLERVRAFHLNDSVKPLGSRIDRHAHIGRGQLGSEPFQHVLTDRRFRGLPMVIETPKGEDPKYGDWDRVNLAALRRLAYRK